MKKIISCLLLVTLVLASVLAIVPASATTVTEVNLMGNSDAEKQWNGEGNVFYFDYHKYLNLGNTFKMTDIGNSAYMLRFDTNNGSGTASVCDGTKTKGGFNHKTGTGMTINDVAYDHVFGYSFKESVVADGITLYIPATATTEDGAYVNTMTKIDIYGASVDKENEIFAKEAEKTLLATFTIDENTPLTEVIDPPATRVSLYRLEASVFTEALEMDYLLLAINLTGNVYKFNEIELNGILASQAADFSALKAQYAIYNELVEAEYTADSWANLETVVATTDPVNQNATSTAEEIATAAANLSAAIETLVVSPDVTVDKTALQNAITDAQTKVEAEYTPATWAPFKAALDAAVAAKDNANIAPTPLAKIVKTLTDAQAALAVRPDMSALEAEIAKTTALKETDYTPNTWTALQTAIASATAVKNNLNATKADVDAATAALAAAIGALAAPGNKTELQAAITAAKALNMADYDETAFTWNVLQKTIEDAETVVADVNATQAMVDLALSTLKEKVDSLKAKAPAADSDTDADADADADATEAPATEAPATQAPATDAPKKEGGCGSSVAISALAVVAVIGTGVALKKKKD